MSGHLPNAKCNQCGGRFVRRSGPVRFCSPQCLVIGRSTPDPVTGCWRWRGNLNGNGYGQTVYLGAAGLAHRLAYESFVGAVPSGLQLDHLCRVRLCVKPAHLEAVTARVNVLRGEGVAALNARKTHCPTGHAYDAANTRRGRDGARYCRSCNRARAIAPAGMQATGGAQ